MEKIRSCPQGLEFREREQPEILVEYILRKNKLKKLKSRSRSMVVWVMVGNGWMGDVVWVMVKNGVVGGVVGSGMDDGMDGL